MFCVFVASSAYAGQAGGNSKEMPTKDNSGQSSAGDKELEGKLRQIWADMGAKLSSGDMEGALGFIVESNREKYRKTFTEMGSEALASFFSKSDIAFAELREGMAECFASGSTEGMKFSYPVSFTKTAGGEWKINDF